MGGGSDRNLLHAGGLRRVLNVAADVKPSYAEIADPRYLWLRLQDDFDQTFDDVFHDKVFAFIEAGLAKQEPVFVQSLWGISRSVTAVMSYLMRKYAELDASKSDLALLFNTNKSYYERALVQVQCNREKAMPNLGFTMQLEAYEKQLREKLGLPRTPGMEFMPPLSTPAALPTVVQPENDDAYPTRD